MKKFMVLFMAPTAEFEKFMASTDKQAMQDSMEAWNAWIASHAQDFVDEGAPLGSTLRVTKDGMSSVKNDVGGYSIVRAASPEAAAEIVKDAPHFDMPGAWIEVMECVDMSAMA